MRAPLVFLALASACVDRGAPEDAPDAADAPERDAPSPRPDAGPSGGDPAVMVTDEADTSCPDWVPMAPGLAPDEVPWAGATELFATTFASIYDSQAILPDGSLVLLTADQRVRRIAVDGTVLWERSIARGEDFHRGPIHVTPEGTSLIERGPLGGPVFAATVLAADGSLAPDLTLPFPEAYAQILVGDRGRVYVVTSSGVHETCRGGRVLRELRAADVSTGAPRPLFGLSLDQRGDLFATVDGSPRVVRFRYEPDGSIATSLVGAPPESFSSSSELPTGEVLAAHAGRTLVGAGWGFGGGFLLCETVASLVEPDDSLAVAPPCAALFDGLGRIVSIEEDGWGHSVWRYHEGEVAVHEVAWPADMQVAALTTDGGFLWLLSDGSRIEAVGPDGAPTWDVPVGPAAPFTHRFLGLTGTHRAWHVEQLPDPSDGVRVRHFAISSEPAAVLRRD